MLPLPGEGQIAEHVKHVGMLKLLLLQVLRNAGRTRCQAVNHEAGGWVYRFWMLLGKHSIVPVHLCAAFAV